MGVIKKMNSAITKTVYATGAGPTAPGPNNTPEFLSFNSSDIKKLEDSVEEILSITNRTT